jgi:hypothetical protein
MGCSCVGIDLERLDLGIAGSDDRRKAEIVLDEILRDPGHRRRFRMEESTADASPCFQRTVAASGGFPAQKHDDCLADRQRRSASP